MSGGNPEEPMTAIRFTVRQEQVIALVLRGRTDAEIAATLHISEQRVRQVVVAVARKLPGTDKPRRRILEHLSRAA